MNNIKQDLLGNIPNIGDLIGFNPPQNSGLIYGTCIGFTRVGLPKVNNLNNGSSYLRRLVINQGYYAPKTGFFVVSKIIEK